MLGFCVVGYIGYRAFDIGILTPTKRVQEYNTGKRVWDPLAALLSDPVRSDEGFICPGVVVHGPPSLGELKVDRIRKVKVIKKYGPDANFMFLDPTQHILGVKLLNGENDPKHLPELWLYEKDFRKSLPCPASQP